MTITLRKTANTFARGGLLHQDLTKVVQPETAAHPPCSVPPVNEPAPDEDLVRPLPAETGRVRRPGRTAPVQRVYSLCLRVLGNPEDAADAVQDTFLCVLKLGQFRGDAAFTTWMHRVAVNACYDLSRRKQRRPMLRLAGDQDCRNPSWDPPLPTTRKSRRDARGGRRSSEMRRGVPGRPRARGPARHGVRRDREGPRRPDRNGEVAGPPGADRARAGAGHRTRRAEPGRGREPGAGSRTSEDQS